MNYVGSVSIIDRGDAPAKAIIDKNVRSLAQRVADETKQELDKVMDRVDNIYVSYEMSTQTMFDNPRGSPNVEYIEDIKELEAIITDAVKKKKYQQQVTVFIVGFQDICAQKMQLLQQVNQFFIENSKLDEEELAEEKPSIDLEEASTKVNESLNTAEELTKRLSDINQDMVDYLVNYANTKASNKKPLEGYEKGKKKLEKSLESARNDVNTLSEKLLTLQAELEEKEDKFQQLVKQLETKSQEAIRYKTAAEVAKKSAQDNENHTSTLQDEILKRDEKIQELRSKLSRLEINLTESQFDTEMSKRRLDNANAQTKLFEIMEEPDCIEEEEEKLAKLQEEVDTKKIATVDAEREMAKVHREQLASLEKSHQEEIEELKQTHMEEIAKLTDELNSVNSMLTRAEKTAQEAFEEADGLRTKIVEIQLNQPDPVEEFRPRSESPSGKSVGELSVEEDQQGIRQESRPSTKDTKSSRKSENKPIIKTTAKSPNRGKEKGKGKEFAETGVQDEGGDPNKASVDKSNDPSRQPTRQSKNLEPVVETGDQEFTDAFELDDEESWSTVPAGHVIGRFAQYRRLSISKMKELGEQLNVTLTKTHRKVNSLKMQFTEHKNKWESERKILIEQVEQAQRLQTDAEKEADAAMTQLEEFINEQEKLEDEEETKRQEIIKTMSRPGTVKRDTSGIADKKTDRRTSVGEKGEGTPREERLHSENSDQELKNLMQQTDDAKANTPISRSESGNSQLAPWLNSPEKKIQPSGSDDPSSDPASASSIDPNSRLTSVADAEIRNIVPDEGISKHIEHKKKEENLKPIDGLKGEREKLMSRTSTRLSRQPKRPLSRNIDEREELPGDESEEGSRLDSQVAPWFTQTDKQPVKRPVTYTTDGTPESQTTVMESSGKESDSVVLSSKKDSDGELEDESEDELDDFSEVKRSQSVEVIGRRSRPLFSRMPERSKSTALENVGEKKEKKAKQNKSKPVDKDIKQVKEKPIQKEKQEKPVEKAPKQDKPIKKGTEQVEKKAVPKGQTQKPKASKQKEIEVPDHSEKRSKTSIGHKPEAYNIRDGAKTAPPKEIDNEHSKDADMNEMMIPLTKDENELISALSSEKLRSASKMSNLIVDLDSRRSMTGTVAKGKMTQMTDVTLPVAMDSDSENEADIDEKEAEEIKHETEIQLLTDVEEVQRVDGTELMTDEDKVRQMSRVTMTTSAKSTKMSRIGFETGRSGALGGFGNHDNQRTPIYTSQSENLPRGRQTVQSTHQQIVSVEVLQHEPDDQNALDEGLTEIVLDQERDIKTDGSIPDDHIQASSFGDFEAQEQKARSQNGAISAPPAVEPDDGEITKTKDSKTPREDEESRPVTPYSRKSTANQSRKILSQQKPETPKEAFRTPRLQSASSISNLSEELFDLDIEKDEGVAMELTPTQTAAMNNLKTMMEEEQFNIEQQKTLDSLRSALRTMSSERPLKDVQLERTVTILSLASQIAKESLELGILPDGVFNGFGGMDSRALSVMSGKEISIKGSALTRRKTVSARPEVIYEPIGDKGEYSKKTEQVVKPDSKTEFKLKADKKKKRRQRSRSRSVSPDRKRSNTPKLFEIQQEKAPAKPSTQSSAITLSGSMDMVYGSSRGDSFSASIPRTLTSSEWRKMMSLDDSSTPEPGETKSKLQKQKTRKDIEKGHKPEKPIEVKDEVTMEPGEKAEKSDLSKEDVGTPRVDGLMTQPSISIVISPKKKSRQVTVEQMLYGDQKDNVDLKSLQPMAEQSVQPSIQPSVQPSIESSVQPNVQLTTFEPNVHPQFVQQSIQVKSVQQNVQPKSVQQSVQLDHEMPTEWYNDIFSYRLDETLKITSLKKTIGPARDTKMQGRKSGNRIINIRFNPTFKSDRKPDKKLVSKCYVDDSIYRQIKPHLNVVSFYDLDTMKVKGRNLVETSMNIDDIMRFEYKVKSSNVSERKCDIENVRRVNHPYLDNQLLLWKQINDKIKMLDGKYLNSSQQQICKDETKNENSCRKALQVWENQKRSQPKGYKSKSAPTKSNKTDVPGKLKRYHTSTSEFKLKVCIDGFTREFKRESFASDRTGISENCPSETVTMATENSDTDLPKEKSPGKAITPERRRSSRTPKPVSAKTKTSHRSSLSPNSFSEPQNSSEGISRQLSFTSNRSLLTAPTPGTNVSDFERPLSKGSFESVENISVSVSDVRIGGNSDKTLPGGSASSDLSLSGGGTNAELSRPLSISSVKPVICASPPLLLCKETQTDFSSPEIEREPIIGETEEEIRISSARSRASLRNQFKSRLDETRHAVEERRTKSPVIAVPPQKSIDDELIDDDDYDEDLELAIPDDLKEDVYLQEDTLDAGTSPPPAPKPSKQSSFVSKQNLSEHPVVHQYLRAYTGVHNFKEALSRIMVDKDQMSASQILAELDMLPFDRESKVIPQIETMTENIYYVLNELSQVINSVLQNDRGPVVSSLMMGMSRDTTQRNIRDKSGYTGDLHPPTRSSERSVSTKAESMISDSKYKELNEQYEKFYITAAGAPNHGSLYFTHHYYHNLLSEPPAAHLTKVYDYPPIENEDIACYKQCLHYHKCFNPFPDDKILDCPKLKDAADNKSKQNQMSEDAKRYDEQQRHNMVVMMEMQDTINQLQRELSTLGKQGRRVSETASTAVGTQQQQQESAIMFTRLDSERNAKIMKKAVNEEKLDPNKYKEVIVQMDEYVNLPAQRLGHLVCKYVHHCRMKEIEENVQKSKSLNENVFEILDKMEALQNQRAKRWADRMDEMGMERMRLANMLMETLDGIEQESGIFLIKPMYSYRGREPKDRYSTKVTRPLRPQRTLSPLRDSNSAYAPAPTPASNVRPFMRHSQGKGDANMYSQSQEYVQPRSEIQGPIEGDNTILTGSSVNYVGVQPKATWSMTDSQPRMDAGLHGGTMSNTPRILELDINRMMIGQNTISAHIGNQQLSNDRLVNASSNNLRSYMTVNRPTGPGSAGKSERPTSGSRGMERSSSSPASYSPSSKHVRMADIEVPTVIPNTQPLPPIGRSGTLDRPSSSDVYRRSPARIPSGDDIPASPPGSSLRQSPPDEQDVENT